VRIAPHTAQRTGTTWLSLYILTPLFFFINVFTFTSYMSKIIFYSIFVYIHIYYTVNIIYILFLFNLLSKYKNRYSRRESH
jgi:hypothetical protein